MATVTIERELEVPGGWVFTAIVRAEGGDGEGGDGGERHEVSLSWVDYEHWSHGRLPPERVVRAVVEALVDSGLARTLPARFDAATGRRWVPDLDGRVRERL